MKPVSFFSFCLLLSATSSPAALAPRAQAELEAEASHIVSGTVEKVTSAVARSKVETSIGNHTDRTFTITVKVTEVSKGDDIKKGDTITFTTWKSENRFPPIPGLQGQDDIPTKGNRVTLYLKEADGEFTAVLPNGIDIVD